jgi:glutathione synthase/RimK-type ligase-like ATP-grasp enzyme
MILFYGRHDDPPLMRAVEVARDLSLEYTMLDQTYIENDDFLLEVSSQAVAGEIISGGRRIPLEAVRGVYARPLELPLRSSDRLHQLRAQTFHELFMEWLELTPATVLNRPLAMESNSSKPFQTQQIGAAGFRIPDTLVSNDPEEVRAFWRQHGRVIYKSVSGIRSIVKELDNVAAARFDRLRNLPTQFQAYVAGRDVRVHVVDLETFATEVKSEAVDYRYAGRDGLEAEIEAVDLPEDVRTRCVSLSKQLCLPLSGIDLRRSMDGAWVCFEVNPMPAYTYFESGSGLPISRAIVELIAAGRST